MVHVVREVRLTDALTVPVGTEITCTSLHCPRYRRGVIIAAYIGSDWGNHGAYAPLVTIDYGPFQEARFLAPDGSVRRKEIP